MGANVLLQIRWRAQAVGTLRNRRHHARGGGSLG
jgi:hypothetical protein